MLFVYGHLTSSTILLRLNLYNDASQNDFLGWSNTSYSDRLAVLGLRSLQLRRLHQDLIYTYKIIFGLVDLILSFSLSVQMKQHVDMLVNCLFVTVVWMFESIFLETALLKFGIAYQQQWKTLPVCESLNPLLSVLTCRSM